MTVTGRGKHLTQDIILPAALLIGGLRIPALLHLPLQRAPFFDRQLVGRNVLRLQRQGLFQGKVP